jgi:hypothetical protein
MDRMGSVISYRMGSVISYRMGSVINYRIICRVCQGLPRDFREQYVSYVADTTIITLSVGCVKDYLEILEDNT